MADLDAEKKVSKSIITRSLRWVDDRKKVDRFYWGLVIVGILLALADFLYKKKTYFDFEYWYGFYALYGFFMCAALVVAAKWMRIIVKRDEPYYAPHDVESEPHPEHDLDKREAND